MPDFDTSRPIFEDPPDDMGEQYGVLLVNWAGASGRETVEMARAYRTAADRLLHLAGEAGESWEAIDPILFCYRHAVELYLKALFPGSTKNHGLGKLGAALMAQLEGRYRADQVNWLCDRISEIQALDPRSTAFRYADSCHAGAEPEIWVDFHHLRAVTHAIFDAFERVHSDGNVARYPSNRGVAP
ncbi:hypothetical protein [Acidibrevibacterium fodinaquatile]|uniref:hypothetical protein n=1 Tax=Acidibrevibacterium fodinaquatile TaxID=1969806 RepID=UPI000E0DC93F|nr:hypothetical protein [Acidibrevibacterium fodinaquatile]